VVIDGLRVVATRAELMDLLPSYNSFGAWAQRSIAKWAVEQGLASRLTDAPTAAADLFVQTMLKQADPVS
jgi:hypothetical protein